MKHSVTDFWRNNMKVNYLHQPAHNREKPRHWITKGLGWENHTHPLFKILLISWKRNHFIYECLLSEKGPTVHDRQKKGQYEEDSTCYWTEILEVMVPKCSLPNLWYDLDIQTTATEVHYRAPELLALLFFIPPQTKLQKRLIQELNIMCNCVINTWTLITAYSITGFICAKDGTRPHGYQRRKVAAKVTIKNGFFQMFSTFPMLQAYIYILFRKTPGFWLLYVKELSSFTFWGLISNHFSALKIKDFSPQNKYTHCLYIGPFPKALN